MSHLYILLILWASVALLCLLVLAAVSAVRYEFQDEEPLPNTDELITRSVFWPGYLLWLAGLILWGLLTALLCHLFRPFK